MSGFQGQTENFGFGKLSEPRIIEKEYFQASRPQYVLRIVTLEPADWVLPKNDSRKIPHSGGVCFFLFASGPGDTLGAYGMLRRLRGPL